MAQDRRGFRFSFDAAAEIAPLARPNATIATRATELSLYGCYLQTPSPLPVQTLVLVKIFHADEYFESHGIVIFVKPNSGLGLEFRDINPYCKGILQKWILAALHSQKSEKTPS